MHAFKPSKNILIMTESIQSCLQLIGVHLHQYIERTM